MRERSKELGQIVVASISQIYLLYSAEEHGIIHERTPPYSPQLNGVAERKNRTLTDLVNAMLDTV